MERRQKVLVYALLAGCAASLTAYKFSGGSQQSAAKATVPAMESVLVVKHEIPAGSMLTSDQVEVRQVANDAKAAGALSSLSEMEGRYNLDRLLAGEQVVAGRLLDKGQAFSLPVTIPAGKRAITVACNEVTGVAGFVKPGDYVDVLGTFDAETMGQPATLAVLQAVQVLAISQEMKKLESEPAKLYTSATLAVTLEQAQKLTLAEEKGRLRLVLRPPGGEASQARDVVTPAQLIPASATSARARGPAPKASVIIQRAVSVTRVRAATSVTSATVVEVIRGVTKETMQVPGL